MFRKILLTIDINEKKSWEKALPQAVKLAQMCDGELVILTVVPDYGTALVEGFFPDEYLKKAVAKGEKVLAKLIAEQVPPSVRVREHLAVGDIIHKVLEVISKGDFDLVVMASHAPDRMREFLVGSNADRIVRRSPVSVLVVRA